MVAVPLLEETSSIGGFSLPLPPSMPTAEQLRDMPSVEALHRGRLPRKLAIYPATAGFDLVEELDFLCARSIEPNIFFNPRFLAPAMPRLEDREVRLAVIRDGDENRTRLRLLVPFSVERPALPLSVPFMRTWSSPFSPVGTPLVDQDDPQGVIEDFFSMLGRPHLRLPKVFVLPEVGLDGTFARELTALADRSGLELIVSNREERPYLQSTMDAETYLRDALSAHHLRGLKRQMRRLGEQSELTYEVAREPDFIREGAEAFLTLEVEGWKGRAGTAIATDRYRAAFLREAVHNLAERQLCQVHLLRLNKRIIASLIVFVENGVAYTWKTAFDEMYAAFSPGTLLMAEATRTLMADRSIRAVDSVAVPDHPVLSRMWTERRPMGTMIVGLTPDAGKEVRRAASQLQMQAETKNFARRVRARLQSLISRARH